MLAWAKPVAANLKPTNLDFLLQSLLYRFDRKMRQRNVMLRYTAKPGCPPAMADAELLERVFTNLVDNALQAMPTGGQLSVAVDETTQGAGSHVLTVSVTDTGHGMTDAARQQAFDPHFTTKPDGTGLGLAICKRLVTLHQGAIGVESYPGSGTVFTVTLPAADTPPQVEDA
jgi:signal transduction histidine kinase